MNPSDPTQAPSRSCVDEITDFRALALARFVSDGFRRLYPDESNA